MSSYPNPGGSGGGGGGRGGRGGSGGEGGGTARNTAKKTVVPELDPDQVASFPLLQFEPAVRKNGCNVVRAVPGGVQHCWFKYGIGVLDCKTKVMRSIGPLNGQHNSEDGELVTSSLCSFAAASHPCPFGPPEEVALRYFDGIAIQP